MATRIVRKKIMGARARRSRVPRRVRRKIQTRRKKLARVGMAPRDGTFRKNTVGLEQASLSDRTLQMSHISNLDAESTTQIGAEFRDRGIVYFKGFKLRMEVKNKDTANDQYVNIAVIAHVNRTATIGPTDFFRGNGGQRGKNFDTDMNSIDMYSRPLNKDIFAIVWRKKFILGREGSTTRPSSRTVQKWLPIMKQIRYDDDDGSPTTPNEPFYLAYWLTPAGAPSGQAAGTDKYSTNWVIDRYFKNIN